jgi:hypothetical protein
MNISECLLIFQLRSGGLLHSAHWLLLWLACLLVLCSGAGAWKINDSVMRRRRSRESLLNSISNSKQSANYAAPRMTTWARTFRIPVALWIGFAVRSVKAALPIDGDRVKIYAPLVLVILVLCGFGAYAIIHPPIPHFQIETHHRVQVLQRVSPDEWMMRGDDLPYMRWKCCPDFDCSTVVQAGYIAATVRYEERGTCKSILAPGLGFFWHEAGETWWTKLDYEKEY